MNPPDTTGDDRFNDVDTTLKIIDSVEQDGAKSQRALASDTEVALGLANAYLKRCIRKGWIKVREAPARRYLYYVTPHGFAEKARLTAEYLSNSFDMFRTARGQCDELVRRCTERGYRRIALVGASDLAEIAALSGFNGDIEIVSVIDPSSNQPKLAGIPVSRTFEEAGSLDAVIVTDIRTPQETYEALRDMFPEERILLPTMLRVNPDRQSRELDTGEAAE